MPTLVMGCRRRITKAINSSKAQTPDEWQQTTQQSGDQN